MKISEFNPMDFKTEVYPPLPARGMIVGMPRGLKVTHIPTGLYAVADFSRSQHLNRETAWMILLSKLAEKERTDAKSALDRQQPVTGWLIASPQDEGETAEYRAQQQPAAPGDIWTGPCCNSCVLGSNWEPLNSNSVNLNKVVEAKAEAAKEEARIRTLLETLETDAHFIFNHNPAQTPQQVRDVIEWYSSSIQTILTAMKV